MKENRVELSAFDTEVFGIPCGKLLLSDDEEITTRDLEQFEEKICDLGIQHLSTRVSMENYRTQRVLEDFGFSYKLASLLLERRERGRGSGSTEVSVYYEDNDQRLINLTLESFSKNTRFHYEEAFSKPRIEMLYRQWICNLIANPKVMIFVHQLGGTITGYLTVETKENCTEGHLGLFCVSQEFRGLQIGSALLKGVFNFLPELTVCSAITEATNYPALTIYQRNDYKITKAFSNYHWNKP